VSVPATRGMTRALRPPCPVIGPTSRPGPSRRLRAILQREIFLPFSSTAASCEPQYRSVPQEPPRVTSVIPAARSSSSSHIHTRILHSTDQSPQTEKRSVCGITDDTASGVLCLCFQCCNHRFEMSLNYSGVVSFPIRLLGSATNP
jgi:hypothetical protein